MSIVGIGVDICEVGRIRDAIARFGDRFLKRCFTAAEIAYCRSKANAAERFAARFAAKEAATKALGTGLSRGIGWQHLEIGRAPGGRPLLLLHGRAAEIAVEIGAARIHVSISHTAEQAIAYVIAEDENRS